MSRDRRLLAKDWQGRRTQVDELSPAISMNQHLRAEMKPIKRLLVENPPSSSSTGLSIDDFKSRCEHFSNTYTPRNKVLSFYFFLLLFLISIALSSYCLFTADNSRCQWLPQSKSTLSSCSRNRNTPRPTPRYLHATIWEESKCKQHALISSHKQQISNLIEDWKLELRHDVGKFDLKHAKLL